MKLVQKLTLALALGTTAILIANGYFRVKREVAVLEADRVRDHDLIGRSLGAAVSAVWHADGRDRALAVVEASNARGGTIRVRWIDREALEPSVAALPAGETMTRIGRDDKRYTYAPIDVAGERRGALELSESLVAEERYTRSIVTDTIVATATLTLVSGALSIVLGLYFVGRPVRALAEKARRIGRGDFTEPVHLRQRDELAELAGEMNAMCDQLVAAKERVARETQARIATLEQLRHADRLMTVGKLASGIAHELGTPLNVVSARAQMIATGEVDAHEAQDYARIVVQASERMAKIIRQLLDFARRKNAPKARHEVAPIAARTLEMLRPLAQKRGVALELANDAPGAAADVDPGQLEQALANLIVNGAQAMKKPGTVKITIAKERATPPADHGGPEADYLCVRVEDQGEGIAQEDIEHIFEPFFTTKEVGEGTGLGLSVTYGIIRDHGGFLSVRSEIGQGSTFSVYLPIPSEEAT